MRRTSVSLPTKQVAHDPHEKPDRYGRARRQAGILENLKDGMMSQAQKTRWVKTGAVVFFILCAIYYLAPSGVDVYRGCECALISPLAPSIYISSPCAALTCPPYLL